MATFEDHHSQAIRNFIFLEGVNEKIGDSYDWQVTVCFYTALHTINAHLAKAGLQYLSHFEINHAINPENRTSIKKLPEDEYTSYKILQNLSRRSRYLVNMKDGVLVTPNAAITVDKHFAKAIRHLDKLLIYFCNSYLVDIPKVKIKCVELRKSENLQYISVIE